MKYIEYEEKVTDIPPHHTCVCGRHVDTFFDNRQMMDLAICFHCGYVIFAQGDMSERGKHRTMRTYKHKKEVTMDYVTVKINKELHEQLKDWASNQTIKPKLQSVVETAIQLFLEEMGGRDASITTTD